MARIAGLKPGVLFYSVADAHVYENHRDGLREQLLREPRPLPRLKIPDDIKTLDDVLALTDPKVKTASILKRFKLSGYNPHPRIKFDVAV
jgi:thymidylate synthase